MTNLTRAVPANTPRPVASWVKTIGPIFDLLDHEPHREREKGGGRERVWERRRRGREKMKWGMWGPVISEVLLRLYGLGLWPNDPIWGCLQVRGWSVKVVTEISLKEELKVIYESQIYPRWKSPWNLYPRWFETFLSSWILFQGNLMIGSRILDKGWGRRITNIYESCYLHIKCFPTNSLAALMWRWYMNSEQTTLQLIVESSGRCEMGQGEAPRTKFTCVWYRWY